jgi:hypothetical protein
MFCYCNKIVRRLWWIAILQLLQVNSVLQYTVDQAGYNFYPMTASGEEYISAIVRGRSCKMGNTLHTLFAFRYPTTFFFSLSLCIVSQKILCFLLVTS